MINVVNSKAKIRFARQLIKSRQKKDKITKKCMKTHQNLLEHFEGKEKFMKTPIELLKELQLALQSTSLQSLRHENFVCKKFRYEALDQNTDQIESL